MKSLLLLCSIGALISTTNNLNNIGLNNKTPLKANEITSFNDYIYELEDKKAYYGDIKNLQGEDLILALEDVISKDNIKPNYDGYSSLSGKRTNWDNYFLLDRDYDLSPLTATEKNKISDKSSWWNKGNIYMEVLYETESIMVATSPNTGGLKYNREHVYPKSHGFNDKPDIYPDIIAGCDMHNLHIGEAAGNREHSNYIYKDLTGYKEGITSTITHKVNTYKGTYNGTNAFEPGNHEKGDIARSVFYMATRYHTYNPNQTGKGGQSLGPSPRLRLGNSGFNVGTKNPTYTSTHDVVFGYLNDLLKWNTNDVVSSHEQIRNSLCQRYVQGNRNPFIDFPMWADVCFNPDTIYVADINKPNGVKIAEDISLVDPDVLRDSYPINSKIDLSKISLTYTKDDVTTPVDSKDIRFTLKNKDTSEEKTYTSSQEISLTKPGNYSLIIEHIPSGLTIEKDFILENYLFAKFVGEIPTFYEGDTLKLNDYKITKEDGTEFTSKLTYKLFNKKTETEETLQADKVLDEGEYYLSIYTVEDNKEYKGSSSHFVVSPLSDSLVTKLDISKAKVGDKIDFSSIEFSYIRNGVTINVPQADLNLLLNNTTTEEQIDLAKTTKYEKEGNYVLLVTYKTDDNYSLSKAFVIQVDEVPFYETKMFKTIVIAIGATLGAIILLVIIILIFKKRK